MYLCSMRLELSEIEYAELRQLQRNKVGTPDYVKVTCLLMFSNGRSPKTISEDLGVSLASIYRYIGQYQDGGTEELLGNHYKAYWGRLDSSQIAALRKEVKEHVYTDAKQVAKWILRTFGVKYTQQGVVDLLNRIGFTYKKTTEVPCEANADAQSEFMEELAKTLKEKDSEAVVYYADGVHPTHNSRSTYAWNRNKAEFQLAIKNFFARIGDYKEELESLLTLRFRLINSQTISF